VVIIPHVATEITGIVFTFVQNCEKKRIVFLLKPVNHSIFTKFFFISCPIYNVKTITIASLLIKFWLFLDSSLRKKYTLNAIPIETCVTPVKTILLANE
jgi:hypothetical protein